MHSQILWFIPCFSYFFFFFQFPSLCMYDRWFLPTHYQSKEYPAGDVMREGAHFCSYYCYIYIFFLFFLFTPERGYCGYKWKNGTGVFIYSLSSPRDLVSSLCFSFLRWWGGGVGGCGFLRGWCIIFWSICMQVCSNCVPNRNLDFNNINISLTKFRAKNCPLGV